MPSARPAGQPKGRVPGLDGVRALAVLAVMAFHEGIGAAPGGFLGVDVFFVLSGYLITDLLASQYRRLGRFDLRGFWVRRARRLLPALAVLLVVVTASVAVIEPGQLGALRPVLVAAVCYVSNWYQALHHVSYFATFGPPPPLEQLWSLGIEEQFYLAWPLILGLLLTRLRGGRLTPARAAWLGAAASAVEMALLYHPGGNPARVYFGTDTHATALLTGCALALTWPLASLATASRELRRQLDVAGVAGLIVLAWAVGHLSGTDPAVYPAGLAAAALAAGGLVLAAATGGVVSTLLSIRPLRWLGVRSYGIYLWHWPVIALVTAVAGAGSGSPWRWLAESGLAIALAALSWRWVETPILRRGFRPACRAAWQALAGSWPAGRRSPARAVPTMVALAAVSVTAAAGFGVLSPPPASGLAQQLAQGERASAASRVPAAGLATPPATPVPVPAGSAARSRPGGATRPHIHGRQVTAIGDSVMLASAAQLRAALPGIYIDAQVSRQMSAGLALIQRLARTGRLRQVVVVGLGTNGPVSSGQIRQLLRLTGPRRALVLVNTYEARPWESEVNNVLAATAGRYRRVVVANWHAAIAHHTSLLWPDEVHPRPSGARLYARVVAAAVRAAAALTGPARVPRTGAGRSPRSSGAPLTGPSRPAGGPQPIALAAAGGTPRWPARLPL